MPRPFARFPFFDWMNNRRYNAAFIRRPDVTLTDYLGYANGRPGYLEATWRF